MKSHDDEEKKKQNQDAAPIRSFADILHRLGVETPDQKGSENRHRRLQPYEFNKNDKFPMAVNEAFLGKGMHALEVYLINTKQKTLHERYQEYLASHENKEHTEYLSQLIAKRKELNKTLKERGCPLVAMTAETIVGKKLKLTKPSYVLSQEGLFYLNDLDIHNPVSLHNKVDITDEQLQRLDAACLKKDIIILKVTGHTPKAAPFKEFIKAHLESLPFYNGFKKAYFKRKDILTFDKWVPEYIKSLDKNDIFRKMYESNQLAALNKQDVIFYETKIDHGALWVRGDHPHKPFKSTRDFYEWRKVDFGREQKYSEISETESRRNKFIYVLYEDEQERKKLYLGRDIAGEFNHGSFTSGEGILTAGTIGLDMGKITFLSNDSGHFHPQERRFRIHMLDYLKEQGADLQSLRKIEIKKRVPLGNHTELMTLVIDDKAQITHYLEVSEILKKAEHSLHFFEHAAILFKMKRVHPGNANEEKNVYLEPELAYRSVEGESRMIIAGLQSVCVNFCNNKKPDHANYQFVSALREICNNDVSLPLAADKVEKFIEYYEKNKNQLIKEASFAASIEKILSLRSVAPAAVFRR